MLMGKTTIDVPVPAPDEVRERLARNLQENRLLRSLLKISERAEEVRRLCQVDDAVQAARAGRTA